MFIRLLVSIAVLLSVGCASTSIKSINEFAPRPMSNASVMPSEAELENRPYKVVVFEIDDDKIKLAKNSQVGPSITSQLVRLISKSNVNAIDGADLVDLKAAITDKSNRYNKDAADFAVTGHIAVANYTKKYNKPTSSYKDKKIDVNKSKKAYVQKPTCSHSALIQGSLQVYDVKTMSLVKTIAISGGNTITTDAVNHYRRRCPGLSRAQIMGMMRSAGDKAVSREDAVLKNIFQPNGYVLERRSNGKASIFKVSIGQKNGIEEGQKAEFFASDRTRHAITGKFDNAEFKVAEGAVTNQINSKNAWIIMNDETAASQIKVGDIVKLSYEKSFFGKIFNRSYSQ